jgi:hypothetical protein
MAALNAVTGAQIRANLARAAREAEMARLEILDRRVKARMKAEAHDRIGQSMALAAQIRKAGYTAKRSEVPALRQMARDFDDRTFELFRLGWLDKLPAACELYVTRVLDQHIADLDDAERQRAAKTTRRIVAPAQSHGTLAQPHGVLTQTKMALAHCPNAILTYFPAAFALRRVRAGFAVGVTGFACCGWLGAFAVVLLAAARSCLRASVSLPRCAAMRKHWAIGDNAILCSLW